MNFSMIYANPQHRHPDENRDPARRVCGVIESYCPTDGGRLMLTFVGMTVSV